MALRVDIVLRVYTGVRRIHIIFHYCSNSVYILVDFRSTESRRDNAVGLFSVFSLHLRKFLLNSGIRHGISGGGG